MTPYGVNCRSQYGSGLEAGLLRAVRARPAAAPDTHEIPIRDAAAKSIERHRSACLFLRFAVLVVCFHAGASEVRRAVDLRWSHVAFEAVPQFSGRSVPIGSSDIVPHVCKCEVPEDAEARLMGLPERSLCIGVALFGSSAVPTNRMGRASGLSEPNPRTAEKLARIERAIIEGAVHVLEKQVRRPARRGWVNRAAILQTVGLQAVRYR